MSELFDKLAEACEREQERQEKLPSGVVRARQELRRISGLLERTGHAATAKEIRNCINDNLYRRPSIDHGSTSSSHCDKHMRSEIREFKNSNPNLTYMQVGVEFNVSTARVSEACQGFRQ